MKISSILKFSHEMSLRYLHKSCVVVDATLGNGHDTNFIKSNCISAKVYGFDIQDEAIQNSKIKNSQFTNINYILDSHEYITKYITEPIDLAIFNLGYLPNSSSSISTTSSSTIKAIEQCMLLLKKKGGIVITIYTEHDENSEEKELISYIKNISKKEYSIIKYEFILVDDCPYCIVIEKK